MQNFIPIAIFIGDGLYNFLKIGILSLQVRLSLKRPPCSAAVCLCWSATLVIRAGGVCFSLLGQATLLE